MFKYDTLNDSEAVGKKYNHKLLAVIKIDMASRQGNLNTKNTNMI